jgi:hypothetical protein
VGKKRNAEFQKEGDLREGLDIGGNIDLGGGGG